MLEKTMIKMILSRWNYGDFKIVFWDKEEAVVGKQPPKFVLIFKKKDFFLGFVWRYKPSFCKALYGG